MGKSIKSRYYQKKIQKWSQIERLPSATYLQKGAEGLRWNWVSPDTAGVDEVEGCEAPANGAGVLVIAKGSWEHKKLQANFSITLNFLRSDAGTL